MTDDNLEFHPWPDILKRKRREMLVEDLLFTTGITLLSAPPGGGKTTLALSVALTVATGAMWAGKVVRRRPVWWVAGEGQDDLRPMVEAWLQLYGPWLKQTDRSPLGGFFEEAIDLSSEAETDKLIALIAQPSLIVLDTFVDMIGDFDDDKSGDMIRVYRNVWRIVRSNDNAVMLLHSTRDGKRGKTLVTHVKDFKPESGFMQLTHKKWRGDPKRVGYEVVLVEVDGYPQPIPIATGKLQSEAGPSIGTSKGASFFARSPASRQKGAP